MTIDQHPDTNEHAKPNARPPRRRAARRAVVLTSIVVGATLVTAGAIGFGSLVFDAAGLLAHASAEREADASRVDESRAGEESRADAAEAEPTADFGWQTGLPQGAESAIGFIHGGDSYWQGLPEKKMLGTAGYSDAASGCSLWINSGRVDTAALTADGDRNLSIAWAGWLLDTRIDEASVVDTALSIDNDGAVGSANAVVAVYEDPVSFIITRAFADAEQGVAAYVECPDLDTLHRTYEDARGRLAVIVLRGDE